MAVNKFHELNMPISDEVRKAKKTVLDTIDIDRYFDEMELTESQKDLRKKTAKRLEEKLITVFALVEVMVKQNTPPDAIFLCTQIQNVFSEVFADNVTLTENLNNYLLIKSWELAERTVRHIDDEFYTSIDRATLIAENETSSVYNYSDYEEAKLAGLKKKTWRAIRDRKTRDWHREVDGLTIPIDEQFLVNGEFMDYPHDLNASEGNIANCRCSIEYS